MIFIHGFVIEVPVRLGATVIFLGGSWRCFIKVNIRFEHPSAAAGTGHQQAQDSVQRHGQQLPILHLGLEASVAFALDVPVLKRSLLVEFLRCRLNAS